MPIVMCFRTIPESFIEELSKFPTRNVIYQFAFRFMIPKEVLPSAATNRALTIKAFSPCLELREVRLQKCTDRHKVRALVATKSQNGTELILALLQIVYISAHGQFRGLWFAVRTINS